MESQAPPPAVDRPDVPGPPPPVRPGRLWALTLIAATLAGVGAWLGGEAAYEHFLPPARMIRTLGGMANIPTFEDRIAAERKNASLANGILGCALGLTLGLAGGLARGSIRAGLACGVAGSLLGLAAGVGASEAFLPIYFHQVDLAAEELSHDLILPLLVHGGIWAAIGASGGAALGLGLGSRNRIAPAVLGGLIGGALGALAYEILGAMFFPASRTTEPLATYWAPRLIGKLAVTILSATIAVLAIRTPASKKPATIPTDPVQPEGI